MMFAKSTSCGRRNLPHTHIRQTRSKSITQNDTCKSGRFIVDIRINETLQIGRRCFSRQVGIPIFGTRRCGAVFNRTYRGAKVSLYF